MSDVAAKPAAPAKTPARRPIGKDLAIQRDASGASLPMPRTYEQLTDMAQMMARGGPMVGKAFQSNPGACMGILVQAMRWGMDPYAVSQKAYQASPDAPISYEGQLVAAVVQKNAPLQKRLRAIYEGEGPDRRITVIGWLIGEDEPFEYPSPTVAQLTPKTNDKGYLKGSQLWKSDPDQQLWYFAVRRWARKWVPEIIMGVYTPEERGEEQASENGERRTITLSGGSGNSDIIDAEVQDVAFDESAEDAFTSVDTIVERTASKKTAVQPEEADGRKEDSSGQDTRAAEQPTATDANPAPGQADSETAQDEIETDDALLARVEAEVSGRKSRKDVPIRQALGALRRIAETADGPLKARAAKLLNMFELD